MKAEMIKLLSEEAANDSIAHGYIDNRKPLRRLLTKAVCELAEAVSAYRDGKIAGKAVYKRKKTSIMKIAINCENDEKIRDSMLYSNYIDRIKDTVQDELADVMIYLMIALYFFNKPKRLKLMYPYIKKHTDDFVESAGIIIPFIYKSDDEMMRFEEYFLAIYEWMKDWLDDLTGEDLDFYIHEKMMFNKLRPYRHGRKDDPTL